MTSRSERSKRSKNILQLTGYLSLLLIGVGLWLGGKNTAYACVGSLPCADEFDSSNVNRCKPIYVSTGIYDIPIFCGSHAGETNMHDCSLSYGGGGWGLSRPDSAFYYDDYNHKYWGTSSGAYGFFVVQQKRGNQNQMISSPANKPYINFLMNEYYMTNLSYSDYTLHEYDSVSEMSKVCYFHVYGNGSQVSNPCNTNFNANYRNHTYAEIQSNMIYGGVSYTCPSAYQSTKYAVRINVAKTMQEKANGSSEFPSKGLDANMPYQVCSPHGDTNFACANRWDTYSLDLGNKLKLPTCSTWKKGDYIAITTKDNIALSKICLVEYSATIQPNTPLFIETAETAPYCFDTSDFDIDANGTFYNYLGFGNNGNIGSFGISELLNNGLSNGTIYKVVGIANSFIQDNTYSNIYGLIPDGTSLFSTVSDVSITDDKYYGDACFMVDTNKPNVGATTISGSTKIINGNCYYTGTSYSATYTANDGYEESGIPTSGTDAGVTQVSLGNSCASSSCPILGGGCYCTSYFQPSGPVGGYNVVRFGTYNGASCSVKNIPAGYGYSLQFCGATDRAGNIGTGVLPSNQQCTFGGGVCHRGPYYNSAYTPDTHAPVNLCSQGTASTPIQSTTGWTWTCDGIMEDSSCAVSKSVSCGTGAGISYTDGMPFPSGSNLCGVGTATGFTATTTTFSWTCKAGSITTACGATRSCPVGTVASLVSGVCLSLQQNTSNVVWGYMAPIMTNPLTYTTTLSILPNTTTNYLSYTNLGIVGSYGNTLSSATVNQRGYCFIPSHLKSEGAGIFIPTKTKSELESFITNAPTAGIGINACTQKFACTGTKTAGMDLQRDWYTGIHSGAFVYNTSTTDVDCGFSCLAGRGYDEYTNTCAQTRLALACNTTLPWGAEWYSPVSGSVTDQNFWVPQEWDNGSWYKNHSLYVCTSDYDCGMSRSYQAGSYYNYDWCLFRCPGGTWDAAKNSCVKQTICNGSIPAGAINISSLVGGKSKTTFTDFSGQADIQRHFVSLTGNVHNEECAFSCDGYDSINNTCEASTYKFRYASCIQGVVPASCPGDISSVADLSLAGFTAASSLLECSDKIPATGPCSAFNSFIKTEGNSAFIRDPIVVVASKANLPSLSCSCDIKEDTADCNNKGFWDWSSYTGNVNCYDIVDTDGYVNAASQYGYGYYPYTRVTN